MFIETLMMPCLLCVGYLWRHI